MPSRRIRRRQRLTISGIAVAAEIAVTFPRLLLDQAAAIRPMPMPAAMWFTAWWLAPLAVLLGCSRSRVVTVAGSATYVSFSGVVLDAVYRNDSSTAFFGVVFMPAYLVLAVLLVLGSEALVRWLLRRFQRSG